LMHFQGKRDERPCAMHGRFLVNEGSISSSQRDPQQGSILRAEPAFPQVAIRAHLPTFTSTNYQCFGIRHNLDEPNNS
jgi:hypothetical protein